MKARILLLLAVSFIVFVIAFTSSASESLQLYFTFDEGKGDKAIDQSGKGSEGEISGGKWVEGKFGKALEFNGTTDYVKVVANDNINIDTKIAILFWFQKTTKEGGQPSYPRIVSRAPNDAHEIAIHSANGQLAYFFRDIQGAWNDITAVDLGKWYHFALTYDGKTYKSYLDGKEVYSFDISKKATYPGDLYIGTRYNLNEHFAGVVDEFAIYSSDLTENEINDAMKKGVIPSLVSAKGKLTTTWGDIKQ
jgi:hypothetical protein